MGGGQRFRVKLEGDQLTIQTPEGEWLPLSAESETRFFIPESDYRFAFVVDAAGTVTGVSLEIQGLTLPAATRIE